MDWHMARQTGKRNRAILAESLQRREERWAIEGTYEPFPSRIGWKRRLIRG